MRKASVSAALLLAMLALVAAPAMPACADEPGQAALGTGAGEAASGSPAGDPEGLDGEGAAPVAEATAREALDALAEENREALTDGLYVVSASCSSSGCVLGVDGASAANGSNVGLRAPDSGDAQSWRVSHDEAGYVTLTNAATGKVLESCGVAAAQGANVEQWGSNGGWNQKWVAVPLDGGGYRLVSAVDPALCLDACGGAGRAGDNAQLWGSNDSGAQAFGFRETVTEREWLDALAAENSSTLEPGTYEVVALCSPRGVLDVCDGSRANSANVLLWGSKGSSNQKWEVSVDDKGYVTLTNANSGKALDAAGGAGRSGDNVAQWTPNGGWNQKWVAVPEGGGVRLYSAARRGVCLDVCGGGGRDGDNVQLWRENSSGAQLFSFADADPEVDPCDGTAAGDGWYWLEPAGSEGTRVDVYGGSRSNNANVQCWSSNGTVGQAFRLEYSDGYYTVVNSGSGLALDVCNSDVVSGANVTQWPNDASRANRQFSVRDNGDGTVTLVNRATGLALDAGDGASGSNVCARTPDGSDSQRFRLVGAGCPVADGCYYIGVDSGDSSVVDLANSSAADGAGCVVWGRSGALNQRWYVSAVDGREGAYTIESMSSAKRLRANADGTVSQAAADDSDESQVWLVEAFDGYVTLTSAGCPSKRLDVTGGGSAAGTRVGVWAANSSGAQRFVLSRASSELPAGTYHVRAASDSSQVLDVDHGSTADCANVLSWSDNGGGNQKWRVSRNSDGTYTFTNCETGKVLDLANGSTADGSNVLQYSANGGANQRWRVTYVAGGWRVASALSGTAVLTFSGGAADGSNACVSSDTGSSSQRFTFGATTYLPSDQQAMAWKAQNYYSSTNWLALVDTTQNKVAIFSGSRGNWTLQKYWSCASGAPSSPTVTGEFTVGSRGYSFGSGYTCYYWTQFYGPYLFHSVLYNEGTFVIQDGRVGQNLSHGCVRLKIENAKWIYDNIPSGTKVVVYK